MKSGSLALHCWQGLWFQNRFSAWAQLCFLRTPHAVRPTDLREIPEDTLVPLAVWDGGSE